MGDDASIRPAPTDTPDWTRGPVKWVSSGFLAGAALIGLLWALTAREPAPLIERAPPVVTIPAESIERPASPQMDAEAPAVSPPPPVAAAPSQEEAPPPIGASVPARLALLARARSPVNLERPSPAPAPMEGLEVAIPPAERPPIAEDSAVRTTPPPPERAGDLPFAMRIRVNVATPAELELLPGVGPVIANRIADDRAANGPFRDLRDLQRVKGIGPKTAERLAPHVRFD